MAPRSSGSSGEITEARSVIEKCHPRGFDFAQPARIRVHPELGIPVHPGLGEGPSTSLGLNGVVTRIRGTRAGVWLAVAALILATVASAAPDGGAIEPQDLTEKLSAERVQLVTLPPRNRHQALAAAALSLKPPAHADPLAASKFSGSEPTRRTPPPRPSTSRCRCSISACTESLISEFDVFTESGSGSAWAPGKRSSRETPGLPADAKEKGATLEDIRGPESVPVRTYRLLWILACIAGAAVLGYLVFRWLRRPRRSRSQSFLPCPSRSGSGKRFDALRVQDLPGQGRTREFHSRLSEILRDYLGARYDFDALECTSTELLDQIRRRPTPGLSQLELTRFIEMSELVKFAKLQATATECKEAMNLRIDWCGTPSYAAAPPPRPVSATTDAHSISPSITPSSCGFCSWCP